MPYEVTIENTSSEPSLCEENILNYAEFIKHYSGEIGKSKQLQYFTADDLLAINNLLFTDLHKSIDTGR